MAAEEGSAEKKKLVGTIFNMKHFWCHSGRSMQILYKHVNNVSQVSAENMQKISKWKTQRQQNKQTHEILCFHYEYLSQQRVDADGGATSWSVE